MSESFVDQASKLQRIFLIIGIVGSGLCAWGWSTHPTEFYQAYLVGYMFWFAFALGSMGICMIHHLAKGRWGFVIQRLLEASLKTLPLMAVLFIPLVMGMNDLYIWTDHAEVAKDHFLHHKEPYLNKPFFLGRAGFYFFVWCTMAFLLTKWSSQFEESGDIKFDNKMRKLSGPGLVIYVLTLTFAAIDWVMSLDPHWYSTAWGAIFVVGQGLSTFAFMILALSFFRNHEPLVQVAKMERFWDLGNMTIAFVMLWGYITLSHFIIVWSGNIPEELLWYTYRSGDAGSWNTVVWCLAIFHFILPFLMLLHRPTKKNRGRLVFIASMILVARFLEIHWLITPSFSHGGGDAHHGLHWLNYVVPWAIGGIWLAAYCFNLKKKSLLLVNDPLMQEALKHG